jgi:HK97 family phage portal protein
MILDRGAKFISTTMTGVDAQHLETRKLQIEEIARAFRVFPQMIGYSDKTATFASAEAFFIAHVVHTLMPWYRRVESSINVNLLGKKAVQAGYFAKFNANALLRGSAADRAAFYQSLWNMGALNANEIRELEDMNPYEGGNTYRVQLNMADAAQKMPAPQPAGDGEQPPAPAPAPKKTDASASMLRHY